MNPADAQRSVALKIPDRAPAPRFTGRGQIDAWEREVPRPEPGGYIDHDEIWQLRHAAATESEADIDALITG